MQFVYFSTFRTIVTHGNVSPRQRFICGASLKRAYTFQLALRQISTIWFSNVNLLSNLTPSSFSYSLFFISYSLTLMFMFLLELTKMSYLSELFFKRLSLNHVNRALDVSFKNYFNITIDITSCNKWNVVITISVSFKMKNKSARNMLKNKSIETSERSKNNFQLLFTLVPKSTCVKVYY